MHWTQRILAAKATPLGVIYEECGNIRFSALYKDGNRYDFVLLYSVKLESGLYEIGCTNTFFFDSNRRKIVVNIALLDRIPTNGSVIDDWTPYKTASDGDEAMSRGYRFLKDNRLNGVVEMMLYPSGHAPYPSDTAMQN